MYLAEYIVIFIYLSLVLELIIFPIPSEASTFQLFFPKKDTIAGAKGTILHRLQKLSFPLKIVLLLLPASIGIFVYLLPFFVTVFPSLKQITGEVHLSNSWIYTGLVIAILGRIVTLMATLEIKRKSKNKNRKLKTRRLFELSRNPILLGLYITFTGMLIYYPVSIMFFGGLIYVANMHFRVLLEEGYLEAKHGLDFTNYKDRTKRYL